MQVSAAAACSDYAKQRLSHQPCSMHQAAGNLQQALLLNSLMFMLGACWLAASKSPTLDAASHCRKYQDDPLAPFALQVRLAVLAQRSITARCHSTNCPAASRPPSKAHIGFAPCNTALLR